MKKDRRLKAKNVERLHELVGKHPGDLTPEETVEMNKLQSLLDKHGVRA